MGEALYTVSVWVLPILLAITLHEAAHGYVAWKLGDDTAYRQGRVSFNPFRHIDPIGTVLLPGLLLYLRAPFLFGYAKPVPVNFGRLHHPRRDMIKVAAAGPAANLGIALASAMLFHLVQLMPAGIDRWVAMNLGNSIFINILLAVFNMLPLPPLDGGRVAVGLLPRPLALPLARLEPFGILLLLGALFLLPMLGQRIGVVIDPFGWLIAGPARVIGGLVLTVTGVK
ncbi:MAG: site-2 protease family protein [Kiloniellales bacterium]